VGDILFPQALAETLQAGRQAAGVRCANSAAGRGPRSGLIISAVTAASSVRSSAGGQGASAGMPYFSRHHSVSPGRKQEPRSFSAMPAAMSTSPVLAPIYPARIKRRCCLPVRMRTRSLPPRRAWHARQHCRSSRPEQPPPSRWCAAVMIKGNRGADARGFLAASRAGVVDEVAASKKTITRPRLGKDRALQSRAHGTPRGPNGRGPPIPGDSASAVDDVGHGQTAARDGTDRQPAIRTAACSTGIGDMLGRSARPARDRH